MQEGKTRELDWLKVKDMIQVQDVETLCNKDKRSVQLIVIKMKHRDWLDRPDEKNRVVRQIDFT